MEATFRLNLYSGKVKFDFKFTLEDNFNPTLTFAYAPWNFYVLGTNELNPSYCNVAYESEDFSDLRLCNKIKVSQAVIDAILSDPNLLPLKGHGILLDASEPKLLIACDIGIIPTEPATHHDTLGCKFYNSGLSGPTSDSPLHRSKETDISVAMLYYYYSNSDKQGWNNPTLSELLPTWRKIVLNYNTKGAKNSRPWNYIEEQKGKHFDGLLKSTLALHDEEQIISLQNERVHKCNLTYCCLLNLLHPNDMLDSDEDTRLIDIVEEILILNFNNIYFSCENTRLGFSLIKDLESHYPLDNGNSPFETLISDSTVLIDTKYTLMPEGTIKSLDELRQRRASQQSNKGKPETKSSNSRSPPAKSTITKP